MKKNSEEVAKSCDKLVRLVKGFPCLKYLANLVGNFVEYINAEVGKKKDLNEALAKTIISRIQELTDCVKDLNSNGFFKEYGLYQANCKTVEKVAELLNKSMEDVKPLLGKDSAVLIVDLGLNVQKALDSAVKECQEKVQKIKTEKRPASEFKKNLESIKDEMTFIFWFLKFERETFIEIPMFLKQMRVFFEILGKNPQKMDKDKILFEVDEKKLSAIEVENVEFFLTYGLTHPTAAIYELREEIDEKVGENDEEMTLNVKTKQRYKKKKTQVEEDEEENTLKPRVFTKTKPKEAEDPNMTEKSKKKKKIEKEDSDEENSTRGNAFWKKKPNVEKKEKPKVDESEEEEESKKTKDMIKVKNNLPQEANSLLLRVVAINESAPTAFKLNDTIKIDPSFFQINNTERTPLMSKYTTKFGRKTNDEQLQSDIKFVEPLYREVSRKQFQIIGNEIDAETNRFIYKIVCTAPPPKHDTGFKVVDVPLPLQLDSILFISDEEALVVADIYTGLEEEKKEVKDEEDGEESQVMKKRKEIMQKAMASEGEKKRLYKEPYLVLEGIIRSSPFFGKEIIINSSKYAGGFVLGKDHKFENDKNNTELKVFFTKNKGWFVQSHKVNTPKFKIFTNKLSLWKYSDLSNAKSDPHRLDIGSVIEACGFSFLVEKN